jgi:gas vesicle protein
MSTKNLFKGLIAGLAIGGLLGILLAPKSGKQVRHDLKKAYKSTSQDVAKRISSIEDISKSQYEQIVEAVVNEYKKLDPITKEQIDSLKSILQNKWSETVDKK